jgi:hypothetical protein
MGQSKTHAVEGSARASTGSSAQAAMNLSRRAQQADEKSRSNLRINRQAEKNETADARTAGRRTRERKKRNGPGPIPGGAQWSCLGESTGLGTDAGNWSASGADSRAARESESKLEMPDRRTGGLSETGDEAKPEAFVGLKTGQRETETPRPRGAPPRES